MASLSKAEKAYIQSSLLSDPPLRADGRGLTDFRTIALESGIAPLANGSARLSIGRNAHDGGGSTEVVAAAKLEVETVGDGEGVDGGRVICSVSCSPTAYPLLSSNALDDLQHDMTSILNSILSHPTMRPKNLIILPGKKSWLLNLDVIVFSDAGNIFDAIFMAARAALWDTKVPRTKSVQYRAKKGDRKDATHAMDTIQVADFELPDHLDEGEPLDGRQSWPVCLTLNLLPTLHFLDATLQEEASVPLKLLVLYSFPSDATPLLRGMRLLGTGTSDLTQVKSLLKDGEKYARNVWVALEGKLKDEDLRRNQKARERFLNR
ncbi:ribosomal protein S5 domain 2-type protein [Suillus paluster]|uniref:ribosomal protein S5 domain 2-type protein n=1 Tax=Suillus paluster TaxID=48578 RepID=UPI001B87C3F9|nr:ribosomal protein S5 domain 2-type protein [Suillus paluster]KAG1736916.1 ribosomal protein S5 domain 2-type protein [Suillus paluster]